MPQSRPWRRRGPEALPRRSDYARAPEPSEHRDAVRAHRARRRAADGHGIRARRDVREPVAEVRTAPRGPGRAALLADPRRARPCAPRRHRPSRSEARQPDGHRVGPDQGHGLRARPHGRHRAPDQRRLHGRHARLHGARTGAGPRHRRPRRSLCDGGRALPPAHGAAAVQGRERHRDGPEAAARSADAGAAAADRAADRVRRDHQPRAGQGRARSLSVGGRLPHRAGGARRPGERDRGVAVADDVGADRGHAARETRRRCRPRRARPRHSSRQCRERRPLPRKNPRPRW